MQQEIGSNFWISPGDTITSGLSIPSPSSFNCTGDDYVWLSTCRSAITLVIKTIEERNPNINKTVLLPSFTCHTIYEPFMNQGYSVKTISIDRRLMSYADDVLEAISNEEVGVVLFHRYFGFDTLPGIDKVVEYLHAKGSVVIEDCTQSIYSNFPRIDTDYFVGSIRKWCGVLDGGFAVSRGSLQDCFVMPSYREGFPNTVMEAGAMGLPSVVTDINGSREIIINGENGIIVPPRNSAALYEAMKQMVTDVSARERMAANARPLIESRFEKSFVQGCLIEFYEEILNKC